MDKPKLSDLVYGQIRFDIIQGSLPPGQDLTEQEFCRRYEATLATVRVALIRLAHDGLIQAAPRKGYTVSRVTIRDIQEVFDFRLLIEIAAAGMAAEMITADDIRSLEAIARDAAKPEVNRSRPAMFAADRRFRLAVLDITGNRRAADALAPMLDWSERIVALLWPDDIIIPRLRTGIEGALTALRSGEKKKAEAQVYITLTDLRDDLLGQVMVSDPVRDINIYQPAMERRPSPPSPR
ncbi:MAG: GntR family transcriptional regulator [Rhodospirillales bacterium]